MTKFTKQRISPIPSPHPAHRSITPIDELFLSLMLFLPDVREVCFPSRLFVSNCLFSLKSRSLSERCVIHSHKTLETLTAS